jgi:hypothetical protein
MYIRSKISPINPTSRQYLSVTWRLEPRVTWEAVTGMEGTVYRGLLRHTLANGALVYPSQGGTYRAEGCKAHWVVQQCRKRFPWRTGPHLSVCRFLVPVGPVDGDLTPSPFSWEGSLTEDSERHKRINNPLALEMKHLSP